MLFFASAEHLGVAYIQHISIKGWTKSGVLFLSRSPDEHGCIKGLRLAAKQIIGLRSKLLCLKLYRQTFNYPVVGHSAVA